MPEQDDDLLIADDLFSAFSNPSSINTNLSCKLRKFKQIEFIL